MPELDINLGPDGRLGYDWEERLLATMCEPQDRQQRRLHHALLLYEKLGDTTPHDVVNAVLGPGLERLSRRRFTAENHGQIAGDLLIRVRFLALHRPRHASLAKAIRLYLKETEGRRTNLQMKMPGNRTTLVKVFNQYSAVSHLWAAWRRAIRAGQELPLADFFAFAEHYRVWGESHCPPIGATGSKRHDDTLLDPATTWKLPTGVDPAMLGEVQLAYDLALRPGRRFEEWMCSTPA